MQIDRLDVRRGATLPYPPSGLPSHARGAAREEVPLRRAAPRGGRLLPCRIGRYTLFDHIGHGGMADLYLARVRTDLGAARLVAIKEVAPKFAHDPRFVEMLASEARLAAGLRHASIVQVEDLCREDGSLFIAMEYVEGLDLRELLRRCARQKVKFPVAFSLLILTEALQALSYAHRKGVVHRDVSPSNVLLSFDGEIKLCDFGIARAHERVEGTLDEALQGKAGYMSPEQARGEALDARSDVFAAGILLWELLAGRRMYSASPVAALSKEAARGDLLELARRAAIPPLVERGLPDEAVLHAIVARALAVAPDDRYPSAAAMLDDIAAYAAASELTASPLRFGAWLRDNFGMDIVAARRARERAVRALELGPPAVIEPVATAAATPRAMEAAAPAAMEAAAPAAMEAAAPAAMEAAAPAAMEAAAPAAMEAAAPAAMEVAALLARVAGAQGAQLAAPAPVEPPSPWAWAQPPLARPQRRRIVQLLVRGALLLALAALVIAGCYLAAR
ncbi:serine/threonine-protein kinase [Sorangium sp. So ce1000]|uniref:serine/threonine-protein kinase n=1 Tax=Sorangium sp. So ce1000 TaxID=3133325 RepID=UPI003F5E1138